MNDPVSNVDRQNPGPPGTIRGVHQVTNYFSIPRIRHSVLVIVALLLVNKLGTIGNLVFYAVLFYWAVRTPQWAVKAISLNGLLIVASPFFVTRGAFVGPLKYLLLFVAGLTILRYSRNWISQPFLVNLLLFGFVTAMLSIYNGYYVEVSLLKIASFTFGAFCLLNVVQIRQNIAPDLVEWGFSLIIAVVLLSYGAFLIGTGYGSYETIWGGRFTGFRGAFSHPQSMGVMSGIFSVYLTAMLLFVKFPHRKLSAILLLTLLILLYLSQARTGMYGYILATGITLYWCGLAKIQPVSGHF